MRSIVGLVLWIGVAFVAGWVGSRFPPGEWYAALQKPAWTPPNSLFGPVWSVLYLLMGIAAWRVWLRGGFAGAPLALGLFLLQLVLNALWSYLFFGLQRPDLAFVDILLLDLVVLATILAFWRVETAAGALLLPYLGWILFASALNAALWRMNA